MTPTRVQLSGVTRFTDLDIDLSDAPEGVIAVVGSIGAGKTTLLECMGPGPFYLTLPSRPGHLRDWCNGREARVELELTHAGADWRLLIELDTEFNAGRGRVEAYAFRNGEPMNDGKVKAYREVLDKHFPKSSIFLASVFAAQDGTGNFLALKTAERRALFAELLGLAELQELSRRAREHAKPLDTAMSRVVERRENLIEDRTKAVQLETTIEAGERDLAAGDTKRVIDQAEVDAFVEVIAASQASLTKAEVDREETLKRQRDLLALLTEADNRLGEYRADLDTGAQLERRSSSIETRATAYEAAVKIRDSEVADYDTQRTQNQALAEQSTSNAADLREAKRAENQHRADAAEVERYDRTLPGLRSRRRDLESLQAELELAEKAAEVEKEALRVPLSTAEGELATARASLERADRELAQAREQAALLEDVPCQGHKLRRDDYDEGEEWVECSECQFLTKAQQSANEIKSLEAQETAACEDIAKWAATVAERRAAMAQIDEQTRSLQADREQVRDLPEIRIAIASADAALGPLKTSAQELAGAAARVRKCTATATTVQEQLTEGEANLEAIKTRGQAAKATMEEHAGAEEEMERLQKARTRREDLQRSLKETNTHRTRVSGELGALKVPPSPDALKRTVQNATAEATAARTTLATTQRTLDDTRDMLGRHRGRLEALGDLEDRSRVLEQHAEAVTRRRAGFRLVEEAFGRTGLQALEIDAAGPAVSDLTNDLLSAITGARFSVSLRTIQEASGSKKQKEVFEVDVLDGRSGLTGVHAGLSGGEKVLISEALKLALSVHNARKSGIVLDTLWRDECDGALDPRIRQRFPAMLRRAVELGGFRRCWFITHDLDVAAQADAVLLVDGGGARFTSIEEASHLIA